MTGKATFVGAGPGDPDLITVRGLKALQAADIVLYDALVDERILEETDGELLYVGKRCGRHALRQEQLNDLIVSQARAGKRVVRLKGGDPTVFGRVGEEALACVRAGVPFEIVPGISSAVAGPAHAGIPVTHRGVADSFCVVTAHRRRDELDFSIPPYNPRTTVVLMMGVGTLPAWRSTLAAAGYPDDLPVAFVMRASWPDQRVVETTVGGAAADAKAHAVTAPAIVVIGHTVALRQSLARPARPTVEAPDERPALAIEMPDSVEP